MRVIALLLLLSVISSSPSRAQIVLTQDQGYVQHFDVLGRDKLAALPDGMRIGLYTPGVAVQPFTSAQHTATQFRGGSRMRSDASAGVYNLGAGDSLLAHRRAPGVVLSEEVSTAVFYFPIVNGTGRDIDSIDVGVVQAIYACDSSTSYHERLLISYDGETFEEVGDVRSGGGVCHEPAGLASPPGIATLPFDRQGVATRPIKNGSTFYMVFEVTNDHGGAPRRTLAVSIEQFSVTAAGVPITPTLKLLRRDIPAQATAVGTRGGSWVGETSIMGEDTVRARSFVVKGEHPTDFTVHYGYQTPLTRPGIARYAQVRLLYDFYPAELGRVDI